MGPHQLAELLCAVNRWATAARSDAGAAQSRHRHAARCHVRPSRTGVAGGKLSLHRLTSQRVRHRPFRHFAALPRHDRGRRANRGPSPTRRVVMISVVTPAFCESGNLRPLYDRLTQTLAGRDWEWIIVDDHSSDDTFQVAEDL